MFHYSIYKLISTYRINPKKRKGHNATNRKLQNSENY